MNTSFPFPVSLSLQLPFPCKYFLGMIFLQLKSPLVLVNATKLESTQFKLQMHALLQTINGQRYAGADYVLILLSYGEFSSMGECPF